jgi:prophage DNA circulation protein
MFKREVEEAVPICERALKQMLLVVPLRGPAGSDLRTAIGDFLAYARSYLTRDLAGPPLADVFEAARLAGITLAQLDVISTKVTAEHPKTIGATLVKNSLIHFCLATMGRVLAVTTFVSHQDAVDMKDRINAIFAPMEEIAADDMAQMTYRGLIQLHAAIAFFLIETARPLPRMLRFRFFDTVSTLYVGYRLYSDAGRADELLAENKVVHPAFMKSSGLALSK